MTCKRAGVWEAAELQQDEADQKAAQLEPRLGVLRGKLRGKASVCPEVAGIQGRLDVL